MEFNELILILRKHFPEYPFLPDIPFLIEMESKILCYIKLPNDCIGNREKELIELLPQIKEYLE